MRIVKSSKKLEHVESAVKVREVGIELLVGTVVDEFKDKAGSLGVRVPHYVYQPHHICSAIKIL